MSKFKDKVNSIFDTVEEYKEYPAKKTVTFTVTNIEFNAKKLMEISDLLGTGTILLESSTRNGGYCSTCSFEYGVMEFTATGVDLS